jgi:crotonobetainyl-CoA:carnitine CoA-transferase CaiB-like acyl-CoA transferase
LAYRGADVLNIWRPNDFEIDFNYYTADIGIRSSIMDIGQSGELARFKALMRDADVFFSNRRPGFLERIGLSMDELTMVRPGIVSVDISIYGPRGALGEPNRLRLRRSTETSSTRRYWQGPFKSPKQSITDA